MQEIRFSGGVVKWHRRGVAPLLLLLLLLLLLRLLLLLLWLLVLYPSVFLI